MVDSELKFTLSPIDKVYNNRTKSLLGFQLKYPFYGPQNPKRLLEKNVCLNVSCCGCVDPS